jgi:hypothetical protein
MQAKLGITGAKALPIALKRLRPALSAAGIESFYVFSTGLTISVPELLARYERIAKNSKR